jgi:hypothetical protein
VGTGRALRHDFCSGGAGYLHDGESNLEHTWFRQLSTTQGRWTVPDPAGVGENPALRIVRVPAGQESEPGAGVAEDSLNWPLGPSPTEILRQILSANYSVFGVPTLEELMGRAWIMDAQAANNGTPQLPKPQQTCYGSNSLVDKTVRFFSLVRLTQTWGEWALGYGSKLAWFGAAKGGAQAAGGEESLGAAAIGTGGKIVGLAGTGAMIGATIADTRCQIGGTIRPSQELPYGR